jgi:protoporphyrinogen/coproporphyrinogen III oxidase
MWTAETIVIGAGISGLSAAYALHRAGRDVKILEAGEHAGGLIGSIETQGFLLEAGPNTFPNTATEILTLCETLHLMPKAAHNQAQKRYLYINGQLSALPHRPIEALSTPVLSLGGKLRVLLEPFQPKTRQADISVAEFLEKRVGREVVENLADPFISGIYAGNIAELSLPAVFPKLWQWEQQAGSLIKGARQAKRTHPKSRKPMQLLSLEGGLQTLTRALANTLSSEQILFQQPVNQIHPLNQGYRLTTQNGLEVTCRNLILAVPAFIAGNLIKPLDSSASAALSAIPYNGLAVVHTGFQRDAISHPLDGFGFLIPRKEKLPLLGSIWASSLFPERAPEGQVLFSNFIGGAHQPEVCAWSPDKIEQQVLHNLQQVFKTSAPLQPTFHQTMVYQGAIPQYTLGHCQRIQTIETALVNHPNLQICGNYLHGIALNECVKSGLRAAENIIRHPL